MAIAPSLLSGAAFIRSETLIRNQSQLSDLNRQLSTGERATTYGDLGSSRVQSISLREDISRLEAYQSSITRVDIRVEITTLSLERLEALRIEARDAIDPNNFIDLGNGNTFTQQSARLLLTETVALLNSQADDRYVFGGNDVTTPPVENLDIILNGDGVRDGLRAVTDERLRADIGANGLGRLDLSINPATPAVVDLAEQAATVFGFDVGSVASGLSNVNTTLTPGEPASLAVDFTAQPNPGETFSIFLDLPDGTSRTVELTARAAGNSAGAFAIGNTPEATAENFRAALQDQLSLVARTDLNAASRITSARNFFDTQAGRLPQRVDTPGTPETAIGLVDADPATTVLYYTGQNDSANPREGLSARVDDTITVNYGLRANEEALRGGITVLAAFAIADFTSGTDQQNQEAHAAFATRAGNDLAVQVDAPSVQSVIQEIAGIQSITGNADRRHTIALNALNGVRENVERADPTEVAVQLLQLQTRIEASFQASARISQLSLLNFLN
ncbi:MAG: hypothetical protein H2045_09880 [Rhizobiales bacterium]|nr:hypothetical protein [Hyphomicrobiales bacterium]